MFAYIILFYWKLFSSNGLSEEGSTIEVYMTGPEVLVRRLSNLSTCHHNILSNLCKDWPNFISYSSNERKIHSP